MNDIANGGRTILFVSHNIAALTSLCQKAILMRQGRVQDQGDIHSVVKSYNTGGMAGGQVVDLTDAMRTRCIMKAFKRAWIENAQGVIVDVLEMGESFVVCIDYECDYEVQNTLLTVSVENMNGQPLFYMDSRTNGLTAAKMSKGTVKMHINNPNFVDGSYAVSFSIISGVFDQVDVVENGLTFEVLGRDVYGFGRLMNPANGLVYLDAKLQAIEC